MSSGVIRHRWQNKILSTFRKHTRHPKKMKRTTEMCLERYLDLVFQVQTNFARWS